MEELLKESNKPIPTIKDDFPNGKSYWERAKKNFKCSSCNKPILDFSRTGLCQECINKKFPFREYKEKWNKRKLNKQGVKDI